MAKHGRRMWRLYLSGLVLWAIGSLPAFGQLVAADGLVSLPVAGTESKAALVPFATWIPYMNMVGDDDRFGYGQGWMPPLQCQLFDHREPEDAGVFDTNRPQGGFDSACTFQGGRMT